MTVVLILAGALLTIAACWASGHIVFKTAGLPSEPSIQFTTGAAALSTVIFAMCAVHLISTPAMIAVGLLVTGGASFSLRGFSAPRLHPNPYWIPFAAFGLFYLVNALAPEISADGTFYHLAFPARYLAQGGFVKLTTNFYGNLSQGMEMLYTLAFAIGKHSAAALTHLTFLATLAAAIIAYAKHVHHEKAGRLAALITITSPVIAMDATLAYNDVALAAVLFSLFFTLTRWDDDRTPKWLIVAGLLAGFAYGIKYTAALATPYAIGFVLWRAKSLKAAIPVAVCAIALIAPWMLKNWIWLDNPVTPFFNRAFPNPATTVAFEDEYRHNLAHFNGAEINWRTPVDLTLKGGKFQGALGPAFLLTPLALLGLKDQQTRRLLFAGAFFLLPWFANLGTRFLIPCAPFLAVAIAFTIAKTNWAVPVCAVAISIATWPTVFSRYTDPYTWRLVDFPLAAALRQIPEADFISPRIDGYAIAKMVDRETPPASVIYTAIPLPEAYSDRKYVLNYTGALNQALMEMRWTPFTTDYQPTVRMTFHPNAQYASEFRILQQGSCGGYWSMAEVRWIPDRPANVTAHPEPWRAQWAHDSNPATRWKIWQTPTAKMYWQATFARPQPLETVEIDASPDQTNTCIELQVDSEPPQKTKEIRAIPLATDLRRQISMEFQNQGITHILIHQDEREANDFETRQADWNITKVAQSGPARLYRLKTFTNSNVSIDLPAKTRNNQKE